MENFKQSKGLLHLAIPTIFAHGIYKKTYQYIILPSFKADVWSLFIENKRKMPMHTIFRLAIQIINAYEYIHGCQYVYANLKGNHVMINDSGSAYIIDFTSAAQYNTELYKRDPEKYHYGPSKYCSNDAHLVNITFQIFKYAFDYVRY